MPSRRENSMRRQRAIKDPHRRSLPLERSTSATTESLADDDNLERKLKELHIPNPRIFWTDLFITAAAGWGAFALAVIDGTTWWGRVILSLVASAAFYRGLCFLHEITHIRRKLLRGFETVWNILFGTVLCLPSIMYLGVHQNHHKLATYGTYDDPEYLPFAGKPFMVGVFIIQSLLLPMLLVVRFLGLSWIGFLAPPFHRWLACHFTALTMNVKYRRPVDVPLMRTVSIQECMVLVGWGLGFTLAYFRIIPGRIIVVWYAITAVLSFVNTLRTLAAHRYGSNGQPLEREEQLQDSVDIPGRIWTELWAPVGLRYHAVHHFYPGIPYHNLGGAYRVLHKGLPSYHRYSESSLMASLRSLISARAGAELAR